MKKIIALLLILIMAAVYIGCADTELLPGEQSVPELPPVQSIESKTLTVGYETPPAEGSTLPETINMTLIETLNKRLNNQDFVCALYYYDLTTGFTVSYNADRIFGAASLIKAPYLYYIFEKVEKGEMSLDQELTYKASIHKFGGTGSIKDMPDGTKLKLSEVIEHICIESDNTGFKMLYYDIMPIWQFHTYAMRDFKAPFFDNTYWNVLTARGVGKMFTAFYEKAESGDENFKWFIELLKDANENKFIRGGLPEGEDGECIYEVAHKYGEDIKSLNDAAIVYSGDSPYVLVVLTDWVGNWQNHGFINRISNDIYKIHCELHPELKDNN